MTPIPQRLRSAVDLKNALDNAAKYLMPIGTCRSKASEWKNEFEYRDEEEDEDEEEKDGDEDGDGDDDEDDGEVGKGEGQTSLGEKAEMEVMEELRKLQTEYMITSNSGTIKDDLESFKITITRPGCEYDGTLSALQAEKDDRTAAVNERLKAWYEVGAVSGYGDVKAQETKVDASVRNAREIPASEFRVAPDLVAHVEKLWAASSFFPTKVRAEAYKIHLYGPGGKFAAHRDTPETDLVGTFLVGLGDTCNIAAFQIKAAKGEGWAWHRATLGNWVAFYPDVDHQVLEIASGYRAVVAFKMFRRRMGTPEVPADVVLQGKMKEALGKLRTPYGVLLEHHYSAGTAELNGVDAALYAAAGEMGGDVKLLPVLIGWTATKEVGGWGGDDEAPKCKAEVFPMTEGHVDALLAHMKVVAKELEDENVSAEVWAEEQGEVDAKKPKLFVDLKGTDAEWINNCEGTKSGKGIRFYSPKFQATSVAWKEEVKDPIEHTGNESRPHQEDSIYLSYAVVVLPKRGTKRAADKLNQ
ncbi:hypothetical protein B0H16DRAFT_1852581 [Mycena metata]|uniref:Fe2OG dioxygenase domain-containing protein n=1 Tax=Mycena metata TaxID=1033252 RepID=A0AAD7INZ8_9AGAR|nr:hypothetical protein B0H16DRAFT_1852581 [Mycena metata]